MLARAFSQACGEGDGLCPHFLGQPADGLERGVLGVRAQLEEGRLAAAEEGTWGEEGG